VSANGTPNGETVLDAIESFERLGLSATEVKLLALLDCGDPGECMHDLAGRIDRSPALVSRAVEELVEKGLAERIEYPGDRRRRRVSITAAGRAKVREFARALAA
jgi:DNA-binding MarR family transcriptional regulator